MIFLWLAIAIAIILFCILKLKLNPAIALVLGSLFMGIASGLAPIDTINTITQGFGNLMVGLGLSVGFGVILGQLLSDSGAAKKIANTLISAASEKYALYALGLTAFILSIPVFYDVTFVILVPLAIAVSKQLKKPVYYTVGAICIGAGTSHTLVPPTPNPIAAAEILHFDLGIMVGVGLVIGLVACILALKIFITVMDHGFWKKDIDELGETPFQDVQETADTDSPCFLASIFPVALPVVLILLTTIWGAIGTVPAFVNFLGNKNIAMLLALLSAYIVASKTMNKDEREASATEALKSAGIVLLVTGAGGSFGAIISATGMADMIAASISSISSNPILALIIAFFVAALFRIALGSGTVASITTMTIMSSVSATLGINPVWIAIACLSGSLSCGHVNDSGFWVSTNLAGFSVTGGLKTYTFGNAIVAVIAMLFAMVGSFIF